MAKFKTTTKSIREGYDRKHIIVFGYCEAQNLLQALEPTDYTCGIYGWNYDVYRIYDVCICTGYRGMPAGIAPDYDITKEYEKKPLQSGAIIANHPTKKETRSWNFCLNSLTRHRAKANNPVCKAWRRVQLPPGDRFVRSVVTLKIMPRIRVTCRMRQGLKPGHRAVVYQPTL